MAQLPNVGGRKLPKLWPIALAGAALSAMAGTAWASADFNEWYPVWRLASPSYAEGRPAISPGNDTRINLLLLMRSLRPVSEKLVAYPKPDWENFGLGHSFMTWQGLRATYWPHPDAPAVWSPNPPCAPPTDAVAGFSAALAAEKDIPADERAALLALRAKVGCGTVDWGAPVTHARSREYLAYLKASSAFYAQDWQTARTGFASIAHARSPWVAETATYMPIRIALEQALASATNKYGDFAGVDSVNAGNVAEAKAAIAAYLKTWPHGRYAASAQGLVRRVLWLEGNTSELAHTYERLLVSTPADSEMAADLAEEIDNKLLGSVKADDTLIAAGDTPLLLAVADLARMRRPLPEKPMPLAAADLAAQRASFAGMGDLFTFLQATHAYYAGDAPRSVLTLLPDTASAPAFTPLAFSGQVVRGMTLADAKDPGEARFWADLIKGASPIYQRPFAELGLALRWQHDARLDLVFAPGSPIDDAMIRQILLQTMASPAILRADVRDTARPAHERNVALLTLLYKDLSRGAYADFGKDVPLVSAAADGTAPEDFSNDGAQMVDRFARGTWSDGFACPALSETVAVLAHDPANRQARLCLGDFWRLNGFDDFNLFMADKAPDTLGHGPDAFPGRPLARDAIYAAIIADHQSPPEERAYALYRAVMCYAPGGNNGCAGPQTDVQDWTKLQVPLAQRKAWFLELKRVYPNSPWARKLRFFW